MGRHSLPDQYGAGGSDPRPRARLRTVAVATVLVLSVTGGTAGAVKSGLLSFGSSCRDDPVRLKLAASPDIAPALTAAAQQARRSDITSDGRCVAVTVTARDSYKSRTRSPRARSRTLSCGCRTRSYGSIGSRRTTARST